MNKNIEGGPINWHTFVHLNFMRLNFIKYSRLRNDLYCVGWGVKPYSLTSSNIDRFSKLFHCLNQENICNNTATKNPTAPQVCRYTTLWNISVLKATIENKTTFVTTRFKKLTTGNNEFYCLSYNLK